LINIPASDGGTSTPTRVYIIYTLIVSFIIPVTLISIFYTMLVAELQRRRMPTYQSGSQRRLSAATAGRAGAGGRKMRTRKITWLVTTVVAVYVVCWLPYWTFQVIIFTWAKPRGRELGRVQPHHCISRNLKKNIEKVWRKHWSLLFKLIYVAEMVSAVNQIAPNKTNSKDINFSVLGWVTVSVYLPSPHTSHTLKPLHLHRLLLSPLNHLNIAVA